jgi:hypothetical protein
MSYKRVIGAYDMSGLRENFDPTHTNIHDIENVFTKNINAGSAVGYVCVKSNNDGSTSKMFGESNPKVDCAYAFIDPKLIVRPTTVDGTPDMSQSPHNARIGSNTSMKYFLISQEIQTKDSDPTWTTDESWSHYSTGL